MSKIAPSILCTATVLSFMSAGTAFASTGFEDELSLQSTPDEEAPELGIVGGQLAKTCHFPTAAYLGGCTATLIHPKVVTTANHCLRSSKETRSISFGEKGRGAAFSVRGTCKALAGGRSANAGRDFAYCILEKEVTNVPIVPVLMGCEREALKKGQPIVLVGFGATRSGGPGLGTKRQVTTPVHSSPRNNEVLLGHAQKGACNGDSGGPAYIDLRTAPGFKDKPGAGWRVFGVTSRKGPGGGNCASTSAYGLISDGLVKTIEKNEGIDVTPCFDSDGKWNPSENCKGFPEPETGGSWPNCDAGKLSGYSHTCGDNPHDKGGGGKDEESTGGDESSTGKDDTSGDDSSSSSTGDETGKDETGKDDSGESGDKSESDTNEDETSDTQDEESETEEDDTSETDGEESGDDDDSTAEDDDEEDGEKSKKKKKSGKMTQDPPEKEGGCVTADRGSQPLAFGFLVALLGGLRLRRRNDSQ